jgi:hypothetical protein
MVSRRALARIIHNPKRERGTCKESLAHASGYEKQSVIRRNLATVGTTTLCVRNWKSHELSGLAPVVAYGEATKPGLAPNGSLNQQSLWEGRAKRRERGRDYALSLRCGTLL